MNSLPMDMLALELETKKLKQVWPAIQAMKGSSMFGRAVLAQASRFAKLNAVEEMLSLLDLLSPEYITDVLPGELDDPIFAKMAERVAEALVINSAVVSDYDAGKQYILKEAVA